MCAGPALRCPVESSLEVSRICLDDRPQAKEGKSRHALRRRADGVSIGEEVSDTASHGVRGPMHPIRLLFESNPRRKASLSQDSLCLSLRTVEQLRRNLDSVTFRQESRLAVPE